MKKIILICLAFLTLTSGSETQHSKKKNNKAKTELKTNFSGIITYYGKVTRIPDRSKTYAKLHDFEAQFELYMNSEYTRRIEDYKNLGLSITITEGIKHDYYMQTVFSKDGNFVAEATPQEIIDYQLTPKYRKTNSLKMRKVGGKKRIKGFVCRKVISDIVTEDNIRIQLVAWYAPELYIEGFQIPYFPKLQGIPLVYDTYNGEHVVTYQATDIKKKELHNGYFGKPTMVESINYTDFLLKIQEIGNKKPEFDF